jgi:DNA-binding MarR family transcriptional regulator
MERLPDNRRVSRRIDFYVEKLEWLGPILVRGLGLLNSVDALEQSFSFSQVMVLQHVHRAKSIKMTDLSRLLGLSKTSATGLIDRLVKRGLVQRGRSEEDRRVVFVSLTADGRRAAERVTITWRKGLASLMRRVPEQDLGPFIATLEQLALGMVEESRPDSGSPRRRH